MNQSQQAAAALWAMLIEGPDDIYAMPSEAAAQEHCDILNAELEKRGNPDSHLHAKAVPWPYSAESHAQDMRENLRPDTSHDY